MPTIPIFSPPESGPVAARMADPENPPYGRVELSPTALAFLIPLFIIFIFGPIACILCIRRTHRGRDMPPRQPLYAERLAGRREDARKKLINVTTHSNVADSGKFACKGVAGADGGEKMADSLSTLERECAICLSPLHAHSLPEPVKLGTGGAEVDEASMTRSVLGKSRAEEILKLRVCGHEFHAECLVSWFILWKYICPICRAVYYGKKNAKKGTANDQTESVGVGEDTSEEGGQRKEEV